MCVCVCACVRTCVCVCACVCVWKVKAPPLQPHVPLLAEDRNPACVALSFPTVSIKREQIGERERCHPCGVSTCCRPYCLILSYSPSIMSHSHAVYVCFCVSVCLHAFKDRLFYVLLCVCVCVCASMSVRMCVFRGGRL